MLIDKKGRLLGKVSIVDVVIVLIILVIVAAAYSKFGKEVIKGASDEDKVVIYLQWDEVPNYVAESIKKGDIVIEDVQKAEFGKVKDITINKSISWAQTDKGEFIKSTKEGYSSICIRVDTRRHFH